MKIFTRYIVPVLLLCLFLPVLTGCNLFGDGSQGATGSQQCTVTIYNGTSTTQHTATYNRLLSISTPIKKGYYLMGYFDAQEGGTKYIDEEGNSLTTWEKAFPTTLYAQWGNAFSLKETLYIFGNEPQHGGMSGQRTGKANFSSSFKSAIKSNFDCNLQIEYAIDLQTGNGWTPSPIGMYVKGYENSGAERHAIFTHTPLVNQFKTYVGTEQIRANDFVDGNIYIVVWNTQKQNGSWAYPVYYSRNLTLKISLLPN